MHNPASKRSLKFQVCWFHSLRPLSEISLSFKLPYSFSEGKKDLIKISQEYLILSILTTKILHLNLNIYSFKTHLTSASNVSGMMGDAKININTNN